MARLIILGNGYDIARLGEKTKYIKFRDWLCEKYQLKNDEENKIKYSENVSTYSSEFISNLDTNITTEYLEKNAEERNEMAATVLVNMMLDLDDDTWICFEEDLSKLPWEKYIKEANEFYKRKKNRVVPVNFGTDLITSFAINIKVLFSEWINQIENNQIKAEHFENKIGNINADDTILVFNYTNTFEQIFLLSEDDDRVFHIHGIASEQNSIIVGHGDESKSKLTCLDKDDEYIQEAEAYLYKDVYYIIKKNKSLWSKIKKDFEMSENNEIYVYGWKGTNVDEAYLKEIIKIVKATNKSCQLFLSNYKGDGIEKKDCWERNNFTGIIELFDV